MDSIDEIKQVDKTYAEKVIEKRQELETKISSEIAKAKRAVGRVEAETSQEEKKATEEGIREGKSAAEQVTADYQAKLKGLKKAYSKNRDKAVESALQAVLGE